MRDAESKNAIKGIDYSPVYLERFFRNLLLGEQWDLRNRYLHINPTAEWSQQPNLAIEREPLHDKLHDKFPQLSAKALEILEIIKNHPAFNAEKIGEQASLSLRQVKTYIHVLKQAGLIVRVGSNKTGHWEVIIS